MRKREERKEGETRRGLRGSRTVTGRGSCTYIFTDLYVYVREGACVDHVVSACVKRTIR